MSSLIDLSGDVTPKVPPKKENHLPQGQLVQKLHILKSKNASNLTHDEALKLAVEAAELQIQFIRLAESKAQQQEQIQRSQKLLTQAEKIKKSPTWNPANGEDLLDLNPLEPPKSSFSVSLRNGESAEDQLRSCREITTHEQLVLWKGSTLNRSSARPWDGEKEIKKDEFSTHEGQNQYQDKYTVRLSKDQASFIKAWFRPDDALPPPNINISKVDSKEYDELKPTMVATNNMDFIQDMAYDCSFVASLCAAAARVDRGHPQIILNIIYPHDQDSEMPLISANGRYVVKLNFNGCFRRVVIDDRLPVSGSDRFMHIVDRNNPNLLWPALIEKAYLKIRGGYDFPGSNSGTDLWVLTGWIPEQLFIQEDDVDADNIWSHVCVAFGQGHSLLTLGTGKLTAKTEEETGLPGWHDYAILDFRENDGRREILIKNPWRNAPAKVRGTKPVTDAPPGLAGTANSQSGPRKTYKGVSGAFWMTPEDVVQNFEAFHVNWNPAALWEYRAEIHYTWDHSPKSPEAGGADGSFIRNPQHVVSMPKGGNVWFLLTRHFQDRPRKADGNPDKEPQEYLAMYIFNSGGKRVTLNRGSMHHTPFVDTPQTLAKTSLPPGTPCTIVTTCEDMSPRPHAFSLFIFSDAPSSLTQALPQYQERTSLRGRWTPETSGGNATSPNYPLNPQYSLRLPAASPASILLETVDPNLRINVRLAHGHDQRITNLSARDIIADSGNYAPHVALATVPDLPAGTYTLICGSFTAGDLGPFSLTVDTDVNASLNPIGREGLGRLRYTLADASFPAGVRRLGCPMRPRRVCRLWLKAFHWRPAPHNMALAGPRADPGAASPIRVSIETGYGDMRTILVASAGGQFSDAAAGVKTEDVDLNPFAGSGGGAQVKHGAGAWLVLERMGGFAGMGRPEERIRVEMFTDTEEPVDVGVWRSLES